MSRVIAEFKQRLLADKDQITHALMTKLLIDATGDTLTIVGEPQNDAIVAKIRHKIDGFRSLVHEVLAGELFRLQREESVTAASVLTLRLSAA